MNIAILGSGGGGLSAVVDLALNGHTVQLWNRSTQGLGSLEASGEITYEGVLGSGTVRPAVISSDIGKVLKGCSAILVCLPSFAHRSVATLLLEYGDIDVPVVLNPGHTGGALEFCQVFRSAGKPPPPTAEFSTLTYVVRKSGPSALSITGAANQVWVAALPGGEEAVQIAQNLYPAATRARDVLASGLANVNMVLHPPGAILGASWIESTGGDFTFYVDGLPLGVGRIMEALDVERLSVAAAFGHKMPPLFDEMQAIGTIEQGANPADGLAAAVRSGTANQKIKAPGSLSHRYFIEDFYFGLKPFLVIADIAKVAVPIAQSLMRLAETLLVVNSDMTGRTAQSMGIAGLNRVQLLERVRT